MKFSAFALFAFSAVTLASSHEVYGRYDEVHEGRHNSHEKPRYDSYQDGAGMRTSDNHRGGHSSHVRGKATSHHQEERGGHSSHVRGKATSNNQEERFINWPWDPPSDDSDDGGDSTLIQIPVGGDFKILCLNAHIFEDSVIDTASSTIGNSQVYYDEERLAGILKLVEENDYDMVGLTEVWADDNRDKVSAAMSGIGHHSPFVPYPDVSWWKQIGSASPGLVYADKGTTHMASFDHYEGMKGTDQLAYKGVAYGISDFGGQKVGWILTHAQASYEPPESRWRDSRTRQMRETLFPAIDKVIAASGDQPIVLLGDLNIEGETEEYSNFKSTMESKGFVDCWLESKDTSEQDGFTYDGSRNSLVQYFDKEQDGKGKRFDYIWLRKGATDALCTASFKVLSDWKVTVDGETINVSDHDPVEILLTIPV